MAKWLKITLSLVFSLISFVVLVLAGYVIYLSCQYYRIEDNQALVTTNNQTSKVQAGTMYSISTYNIGFGAYSHDFTFFMDSGEMLDGTKTQGSGSRAKDKQTVLDNTSGAISWIMPKNVDFAFFQEVDTNSSRSYGVNQFNMLQEEFLGYSSTFASNFHSGYLFYPLTNPHGKVESGISTFSKYEIESAVRRSFPIDESFPTKFFDLDRCFSVFKLPVADSTKKLVLINLHMSAYDEGGKIRAKQLELLTNYIQEEYDAGNYVIAGGDWNHDIANSKNYFKTGQKIPNWVGEISADDIPSNFSFAQSLNAPTCRSTDIAYTKNESDDSLVNYNLVIDGFLVSDNITINFVENIDTDFLNSDHNPVFMQFTLN